MGHPGKHIVDPETGLCEICDEAAIQEVYNGKRPGKQIFYANNDRRYIHRSRSDEIPDTRVNKSIFLIYIYIHSF
jgi:hypothetical protein